VGNISEHRYQRVQNALDQTLYLQDTPIHPMPSSFHYFFAHKPRNSMEEQTPFHDILGAQAMKAVSFKIEGMVNDTAYMVKEKTCFDWQDKAAYGHHSKGIPTHRTMGKTVLVQPTPSFGEKEVPGGILRQSDGIGPETRPRRPQSAFETFVQYEEPLLADNMQGQNMTSTDITKFRKVQWQSMEHWRKDVYIRLAQGDRERYVKEIKEWKASQNPVQGSVAAYLRAKLVKPAPQRAQSPMSLPINLNQSLPCGLPLALHPPLPLALPPPLPQTSRQSTVPMLKMSTRILKRDMSCSCLPQPNAKNLRTEAPGRHSDGDFEGASLMEYKAPLVGDDLDGSASDNYLSVLIDGGMDGSLF
jgi:hypothetical protein